ncbi:aliphatic sulfonate ABC transporter substrate-binding protein [Kozakia baliensis]|uniref:aliphatic sulfonate ABC transporter substrate-binding protein n=1 Tax=Kozakia baliensis TaxID=153496 RepID=UPI0005622BC9|nr:aliphatic sulfonate ABC transporter substrate-binding protein [Kozakia baliensis]
MSIPVLNRRFFLSAAAITALQTPWRARASAPVRIGYQRYSTLILLKHLGLLEKMLASRNVSVEWSEFVAGPQLLQAISAGAIDLGQTGDAPPVFAAAAQSDGLIYLGYEPPAPDAEALLVRKDSPIQTLADLRGKRVALNRGSNVHWFLLQALKHAGLSFTDIHPTYLTPPAARAAFESGRLDAWAIWDPYFSSALSSDTRILTTAEGIVENREFFLTSHGFGTERSDLLPIIAEAIAKTDEWAMAHPDDVATIFAKETGLPFDAVRRAVSSRHFSFHRMDEGMIEEQQHLADSLFDAKLIPARPEIVKAVWH